MNTLEFLQKNVRFLAFGFAVVFFSSFGQTFFLSLFAGQIQEEFGLTHGSWGFVYLCATLASAFTVARVGGWIDKFDLRAFTLVVCAGIVLASFAMSAVTHVVLLGIAIYGMRLSGQGLMGHIAMTAMGRYFDAYRGRAVSAALFGAPVGESLLPPLAVALTAAIGWRQTWVAVGALLALTLIPIVLFLLRGQAERHEQWLRDEHPATEAAQSRTTQRSWTRGEVARDPRFYLVLPAAATCGFLMTGFFFHQIHLVEAKGWDLQAYSFGFSGFAAAQVVSMMIAGPLIDRFGARGMMRVFLLPIALGLVVLATRSEPVSALWYFILVGMSGGSSGTLSGAFWAETYGTKHLGAIRAMLAAIFVGATALSPAIMGTLIDRGMSMEAISWLGVAWVVVSAVLAWIGIAGRPNPPAAAAGAAESPSGPAGPSPSAVTSTAPPESEG